MYNICINIVTRIFIHILSFLPADRTVQMLSDILLSNTNTESLVSTLLLCSLNWFLGGKPSKE